MPRPGRPQPGVTQWISQLLNANVTVENCPSWLVRPGQTECKDLWQLVQEIYSSLTGMQLPETMPSRELRRIDITLHYPDGSQQFLEVDETQHFNEWRALTLGLYPQVAPVGFPKDEWIERSAQAVKLPGGGFARPKPPLFPEQGGRHRQRAYRDALADLLPWHYGLRPTLRVSDLEVAAWQATSDPIQSFTQAMLIRGLPAEYVLS